MKKFYHVFPGAVSNAKCDEIIRKGLDLPAQNASIGNGADAKQDSYRVSTIRWFDPYNELGIKSLIEDYAMRANRVHFGFDISFGTHEIQFTEYHGNQNGKYGMHIDTFWDSPDFYDRKLSFVLQLSDPNSYEGGNFDFSVPGADLTELQLFRQRGSVLVFPSYFMHGVQPVTKGIRYSLVSWIDGPKFR